MISVKDIMNYLENENIEYGCSEISIIELNGCCSLNHVVKNSITWLKEGIMIERDTVTQNNLLLITTNANRNSFIDVPNVVFVDEPKRIFFKLVNHFFVNNSERKISNNACVETDKIGKNVSIGHFCYIGRETIIGNDVVIGNNVTIECPTFIGDNAIIHSGVVIGTDGYGYYLEDDIQQKVPHLGGVRIEKNVEIGANTCIDRGTIDDTFIGENAKIDNLCHIAHNCIIEKNSMVIALSMLGGSSHLGENSYLAPGCMIMNQKKVGVNSVVGMGSVVINDVEDNKVVVGVPARIIRGHI